MKLAIERHSYAPELNKLFVIRNGRFIELPLSLRDRQELTTIKEARKLFKPYKQSFLHVTIKKLFTAPYEHLNKVQSGKVSNRQEVINFIKEENERNQYGQFIDNSHSEYLDSYTMPMPKWEIKTRIIG